MGASEDNLAAFLYMECPHLQEFQGTELNGAVVSHWYQERAKDIERQSHFVDAALDLLKLGRERGVQVRERCRGEGGMFK